VDRWNQLHIILEAAKERENALKQQLEEERERGAALRIVISALIESTRWLGLNRSKFRSRIVKAGQDTPNSGPSSARHSVLLAEAKRVLSHL
jgi:hypothetical protein